MKRLNKEKWLQTGLDILKKTSYTDIKIEYFTKLYSDTGVDPEKALIRANLNFALLVGIYQLFYNGSKSEINELIPEINNLFN